MIKQITDVIKRTTYAFDKIRESSKYTTLAMKATILDKDGRNTSAAQIIGVSIELVGRARAKGRHAATRLGTQVRCGTQVRQGTITS
jgi:hypothetical protein